MFGVNAAFEILARRQAEKGMGRAGVTVGATMLAAAIDVDRAIESEIRRLVASDDGAAFVRLDSSFQLVERFIQTAPTIVAGLARIALISTRSIACGTPTFAGLAPRQIVKRSVIIHIVSVHAPLSCEIRNI